MAKKRHQHCQKGLVMSEITLSAGVRQNLLSLQQTASLFSQTQNRLATGKKVNSALDNPTNFFTSQSLSARANDFNSLLDDISNATKTLQAADKGITAVTNLVKSAQSTARQALQDNSTDNNNTQIQGGFSIYTSGASGTSTRARAENQTLSNIGFANNDTFTVTSTSEDGTESKLEITIGGGDSNDLAAGASVSDLVGKINASGVANAEVTSDGRLNIKSSGAQTLELDITDATGAAATDNDANGSSAINLADDSIFARLGFDESQDVNGTGASPSPTSPGGTDVSYDEDFGGTSGSDRLSIQSTAGEASANRDQLVSQYNEILNQIDELARDASYNGVNLVESEDAELVVSFNEHRDERKSQLKIAGADITSSGLSLNQASSFSKSEAESRLDELSAALISLRSTSSRFGSNLSTVNIRQDFTKGLSNTLQTGADALVLADTNEEGANLLALQTRQSLSTTALSLASQADQAVLRLL